MIREDVLQRFPELFGTKKVNGRDVNVEETIATLTRELRPAIAEALNARRALLESPEPVRRKYAWPKWDETFEDPVTGGSWTFRQIVQGLIDNFLDRESEWRWRLNDEVPIPADVHPLKNPGLELTGPWHPLDMAFNALNSAAPMNMPDFEDASPSHFQPQGTPNGQPVGTFAALQNAKEILEGRWSGKPYEVSKKDKKRSYKINRPPQQWPTRLVRPPSIHVVYEHITVDGQPAPGLIAVVVLWVFNNYDALKRAGTGVYFYIPKMQTPREALIVEKLLARVEGIIGVPAGTFKIKILYEEGNGGRYLPAIAWVFRRRLLGTNVGRWDYLGSLIEMWKDDPNGVFPDPQTIGMASPNMIAYQRYNALTMLMAGMKHGELTQGGPIGGMAAVMIYQASDAYGRSRYNPVAMRAIVVDKLRERLLGLMFVPDEPIPAGRQITLDDILAGRVKGRLYDAYRQSWVASPETAYVAAGNGPLRVPLAELQAMLDAPRETVDANGKAVPTVASGLVDSERALLESRGLLNAQGKITPSVISKGAGRAGEAPSPGAVGGHLQRAQGRRHHRAHPARVLHGRQLRLPDPERQLRRGHRRLRTQAALHERSGHLPDRRFVAMDAGSSSGGHHQGRIFPAVGAHGRRHGAGAKRPRRSRPGPASPRSCSRRCGIITTNGQRNSSRSWTGTAIRGASTGRKRRPSWNC